VAVRRPIVGVKSLIKPIYDIKWVSLWGCVSVLIA